jgi:hypothetical protein
MEPARVVYVGALMIAATLRVGSLRRLPRISGPDTRRGLAGLLGLTGVWSAAHVGRLLPLASNARAGF